MTAAAPGEMGGGEELGADEDMDPEWRLNSDDEEVERASHALGTFWGWMRGLKGHTGGWNCVT